MFTLSDDEIARHSVTTMLWQEGEICDEYGEPTSEMFNERFDINNIESQKYVDTIISDVKSFVSRIHPADLSKYLNTYSERALIHDYWLTRNHHGAGFWDRGLEDVGERLTSLAQADCEYNVYDWVSCWGWE